MSEQFPEVRNTAEPRPPGSSRQQRRAAQRAQRWRERQPERPALPPRHVSPVAAAPAIDDRAARVRAIEEYYRFTGFPPAPRAPRPDLPPLPPVDVDDHGDTVAPLPPPAGGGIPPEPDPFPPPDHTGTGSTEPPHDPESPLTPEQNNAVHAVTAFYRRLVHRPLEPGEQIFLRDVVLTNGGWNSIMHGLTPNEPNMREFFVDLCQQHDSILSEQQLREIFDHNRYQMVVQPLLEERPAFWQLQDMFAFIGGNVDPENIIPNIPQENLSIDTTSFTHYTRDAIHRPFILITQVDAQDQIEDGFANPAVVPYSYATVEDDSLLGHPPYTQDVRFRQAEGATDGDSGLFALAASSARNPAEQARLYQFLANAIVDIHHFGYTHNNNILETWLHAQNNTDRALSSFQAFQQFDRIADQLRPPRERLVELSDFDGTWRSRMNELHLLLTQSSIKLQPYHLRWIEFLAHSVDVGQIIQDQQEH